MTNSGSPAQYLLVAELMQALIPAIAASLSTGATPHPHIPIDVVAVPGNHDCDFSELSEDTRALIAESPLTMPERATDASFVDLCLSVQRSFTTFLTSHEPLPRTPAAPSFPSALAYEYRIGDSSPISIRCYNTAWVSQLHEQPGRLYFPSTAIIPTDPDVLLTISVLHHPIHWLSSSCARDVRDALASTSDFVFTGHEHEASKYSLQLEDRAISTHFEAAALQDTSSASAFTTIVIDTDARQYRYAHHTWDGHFYIAHPQADATDATGMSEWRPYPLALLRKAHELAFTSVFASRLDDLGIVATHRRRGVLRLSDIYVYPDLRSQPYLPDTQSHVLRGERVLELLQQYPHLLITGATQSGKTALAKTLVKDIRAAGRIPLFLDGSLKLASGERLYKQLDEVFATEYSSTIERFRQIPQDSRVIIIDDFHRHRYSAGALADIVDRLARYSGHIVLIADEMSLGLRELSSPMASLIFAHYSILPFGHVRRNRLIERWLHLDAPDEDATVFVHELTRIQNTLNTLIGRNYVPAYPAYILAVLQAAEATTPIETGASTHGYFYELFIKAMIGRAAKRQDIDVIMGYLAFLAYRAFLDGRHMFNREWFVGVHQAYVTTYAVSRQQEEILTLLVDIRMLRQDGSRYVFTYPYIYYYCLAAYMRDHIGNAVVRGHVRTLSRSIYKTESANVLLFLAHLSKDPIIVAELLSAARDIMPDVPEFTYGDDARFLNTEGVAATMLTSNASAKGHRRGEMLEAMDATEAPPDEFADTTSEPDLPQETLESPLVQLTMALKALQILGQVVKNFPGTLEVGPKTDLVRECCGLGLRSIGLVFDMIRRNRGAIIEFLAECQAKAHPQLRIDEAREKVEQLLAAQARLIGFGVVRSISSAVGSRELWPIYDRLLTPEETPALQLVRCSLLLDTNVAFPEDAVLTLSAALDSNYPARNVLRMLVLQHLYMFPVDYQASQRVCAGLEIPIGTLKSADPSKKLLRPKSV